MKELMSETLISYETAKLAKKYGFEEKVIHGFSTNYLKIRNTSTNPVDDAIVTEEKGFYEGKIHVSDSMYQSVNTYYTYNNNKNQPQLVARPTQAQLQKWLRDRVVDVIVVPSRACGHIEIDFWQFLIEGTLHFKLKFNSYEEALEAGLLEGLRRYALTL